MLELLSPAGDLTRLYAAVEFGADAVYLAGPEFGMRAAAANFNTDDLKTGIKYAHENGVKVHVTCNTIPHNEEIARLPEYLKVLDDLGVDAVIASDFGTIELIKKHTPNLDIHVSVQAGVVNYETANAFYNLGAKRIVLARELSIEEIAQIRQKTPKELELEAFVHGAMCVSFSARCLLSSYMTGRDANRGDCAQPCRWSYALMEEKRPGQYFPVNETADGTYILNANDLCMIEHIAKLERAGIKSLKIEGRAKSHYYVAAVTNAYYLAIQSYYNNPSDKEWHLDKKILNELNKVSHRGYSTGFYFGKPKNSQTYENAGYVRDYQVAAVVTGYKNGYIKAVIKNKFLAGTCLDVLEPKSMPFELPVTEILDESGNLIDAAIHPMMTVNIPCDHAVKTGSLLRMKSV